MSLAQACNDRSVKGIAACHHSPLAPTFLSGSGPLFKSGRECRTALGGRGGYREARSRPLCKKFAHRLNLWPAANTKMPSPAPGIGFSNLLILWGWCERFYHPTGPAAAGPLSCGRLAGLRLRQLPGGLQVRSAPTLASRLKRPVEPADVVGRLQSTGWDLGQAA